MTVSNSSAARRAGFKVNNVSVKEGADIAMTKIGTRTLTWSHSPKSFHFVGAGVVLGTDGLFNVVTMPDANTGTLYAAHRLPAEFIASDVTVDIYWKTTVVVNDAKFSVSMASKVAGETTAATVTTSVFSTAAATAGQIVKASVTFDSSNFTAADFIGLLVGRDPTGVGDDLGVDLDIVHVVVKFTGRG